MDALLQNANFESKIKRGRLLEYFTISWNIVEATVSLSAGFLSGSAALIGFGFDAVIESLSAITLLWRLRKGEKGKNREKIALCLVGISFLILAAYIAFEAVSGLIYMEVPEAGWLGITIACLSLIIMPIIAREKRKVAFEIKSEAMRADSKQTDLCAYLSAILLGGLLLNALFGWWWADSVAALLMCPIIVREGINALRGRSCDDCGAH